ncbi:MAG: radical SAM family heme chaperone HemW [Chitinophagales bacterium]|nr:radical SAM family heme chaperone HemW [Chitinophagales bacterium]
MAGIYVHIPFCEQVCAYCNFYFITSVKWLDDYINALCIDIAQQIQTFPLAYETLYFGGGTPSFLKEKHFELIYNTINKYRSIDSFHEINIECNPEHIDLAYIQVLKKFGINRVNLGVQSFDDMDLKRLKRNHDALQSLNACDLIATHFDNFSFDLMYSLPYQSLADWDKNLSKVLEFHPNHLSCYNLTLEEKTALKHQMSHQLKGSTDESLSFEMFQLLHFRLREEGMIHYEISNLAKLGFEAKHNLGYWQHKPYLGIGPSAHSFIDGKRFHTIAHVKHYIQHIYKNESVTEIEKLTDRDFFNEILLLRLRTKEGLDLNTLPQKFDALKTYLLEFFNVKSPYWICDENKICLTLNGWFISDHIISEIMLDEAEFEKRRN